MKKITLLFVLIFYCGIANAFEFDFSQKGDKNSNEILLEYVKNEIEGFHGQVVSYFYDIDSDNNNEIIGIVKSKLYCTLRGYKLLILKQNKEAWSIEDNDIFIDNSKKVEIQKDKIIYFGNDFYKNKKFTAKINKNNIKTSKTIQDNLIDRQLNKVEGITQIKSGKAKNNININDFSASEQEPLLIEYKDLNKKTKHYLYMK